MEDEEKLVCPGGIVENISIEAGEATQVNVECDVSTKAIDEGKSEVNVGNDVDRGFFALQKLIATLSYFKNPCDRRESVKLHLHRSIKFRLDLEESNLELQSRHFSNSKPAFVYFENPVSGWCKQILVSLSTRATSSLVTRYVDLESGRKFDNESSVMKYFERNPKRMKPFELNTLGSSSNVINNVCSSQFDFAPSFCICHARNDPANERNFIQCAFGYAGCNRWVHPECVGLGVRSDSELPLLPRVVCPFCVTFLTAAGKLDEFARHHTNTM
jgi:hypothetical protein